MRGTAGLVMVSLTVVVTARMGYSPQPPSVAVSGVPLQVTVPWQPVVAPLTTAPVHSILEPSYPLNASRHVQPELPVAQAPLRNVGWYVSLAAQWLKGGYLGEDGLPSFPAHDLPYIRFLHWQGVPDAALMDWQRVMCWWMNQLSFEQALAMPHAVPGSDGRLWWVDLRDYRWNAAAWSRVASREPYTQEPWVAHADVEYLQTTLGIYPVNTKDSYPVDAVMSAPWLFRETIESDRSQSYYDLLFGAQRFLGSYSGGKFETYTEKITVNHTGGDYIYPDDSGRIAKNVQPGTYEVHLEKKRQVTGKGSAATFRDFPKNLKEWESAFSVDVAKAFAKQQYLNLDFGAIVEGGADNPAGGSIVALHNRLLVTTQGAIGLNMQSFDVFQTAGERNYIEDAPNLPGKVAANTIRFDAGELLSYLPNGGQAAFLIDGKGNRAEIAANKAAFDSSDKRLNPGVRNPGSCVVCHAPSNGYIMPDSLVKKYKDAGIETKIYDRELFNRFKGFYFRWEHKIKAGQTPYGMLVADATTPRFDIADQVRIKLGWLKAPKTWDGSMLAKTFQANRDYWDNPVTAEQACLEWGISMEALKRMVKLSPRAMTNGLGVGMAVPRQAWEVTADGINSVYREGQLIMAAKGY